MIRISREPSLGYLLIRTGHTKEPHARGRRGVPRCGGAGPYTAGSASPCVVPALRARWATPRPPVCREREYQVEQGATSSLNCSLLLTGSSKPSKRVHECMTVVGFNGVPDDQRLWTS